MPANIFFVGPEKLRVQKIVATSCYIVFRLEIVLFHKSVFWFCSYIGAWHIVRLFRLVNAKYDRKASSICSCVAQGESTISCRATDC